MQDLKQTQRMCEALFKIHWESLSYPSIKYEIIKKHFGRVGYLGYGMYCLVETATSLLLYEVTVNKVKVVATYPLPSLLTVRTDLLQAVIDTFDTLLFRNK